MAKISYTLLTHKNEISYKGDPIRVDVFSGNTQNLHTVSVQYSNFVGRFYLEGTLSSTPQETDWFPIYLSSGTPYKQYPATIEATPTSGNDGFSFRANLLYIRARVDRDYLSITEYNQGMHGTIDKVLINI